MPGTYGETAAARPWLSVVVPSHEGHEWLAATLESVVAQGDPEIEVVVVDGSTSAEPARIAAAFQDRLALRLYRRPDLATWMAKTNFAVERSAADWISILHQDDLWLPGRAARVRQWIAAEATAVMHLHPAHIIDASGKRVGTWHCPLPAGEAPLECELLLARLLVQNFVAMPAPAIRRAAFQRAGGLDEGLWYTADWDLYLKLAELGTIYYRDEALAAFRIHPRSQTMSGSLNLDDFRAQMRSVIDRHIGRLATRRRETARLAKTSVSVNVALAAANRGNFVHLLPAGLALLTLGPRRIRRFLNYSRIVERAYPRLRAKLAGVL